MKPVTVPDVDVDVLRCEIQKEYAEVASHPDKGFHFHTGRRLAAVVGYSDALLDGVPERSIESFAGTGNPFSMGALARGERVVDIGCGAGIDTMIAARMVGAEGQVIGVDMTPEMLSKAQASADELGYRHVTLESGHAEALPVEDGWADVVIANGVLNLCPDKIAALNEMNRALKPGGRLQIADILVQKPVSDGAKRRIDLWTG
jgi:arsenite methyltransferase